MSFTTPCFIKKNTPELRKKLEELGYEKEKYSDITDEEYILLYNNSYTTCPDGFDFTEEYVDCGTNENLFLSIAALRDDTDYMQSFTDGIHWYKMANKKPGTDEYLIDGYRCHKATVEELINHFKTI